MAVLHVDPEPLTERPEAFTLTTDPQLWLAIYILMARQSKTDLTQNDEDAHYVLGQLPLDEPLPPVGLGALHDRLVVARSLRALPPQLRVQGKGATCADRSGRFTSVI